MPYYQFLREEKKNVCFKFSEELKGSKRLMHDTRRHATGFINSIILYIAFM